MADMVNHPPHYQSSSGMEVIDVVEAFDLGFHLGNVVKYLLRAGRKGDVLEDLKKARWYLDREIERKELVAREAMPRCEYIEEMYGYNNNELYGRWRCSRELGHPDHHHMETKLKP